MRVLVTGGAGRLGTTVCKALAEDGYVVRVFDLDSTHSRKSVQHLGEEVEIRWGDITNPDAVREALDGVDAVVHMAGILPPVADERPELAHKVNVEGTQTLVESIAETGRQTPIVFTSSVAVFGPTPDATEPISPDRYPPNPKGAYGQTKLEAERVIKQAGIDYLVLRLTAIMYFTFNLSDMKRIFSVPLNNRIEFCHPDDLARAVVNAVGNFDRLKGQTLVVSGGPDQRMTYRQMVGAILGVMGLPLPPDHKFTREAYYLDWYDTGKSQRLLRFQRKTFADYLDDYARGLAHRYGVLFIPFMRRLVSPVFGKLVVQFI
jgi:nucleoside-diphosphate-sugar epimerase